MIYTGDLNLGQSIEIENSGSQTRLSLSSHGAGGQQSQSSSFETGAWTQPPTLERHSSDHILRIKSSRGTHDIRIGSGGISLLQEAPQAHGASEIPLRQSGSPEVMPPMKPMEPMRPMPPMKPMAPMRMGDMEMKPGEMRMGNMRMSLNEEHRTPQTLPQPMPEPEPTPPVLAASGAGAEPVKARFCTQCGERAQAEDRFCHACGHRLRAGS